MRNIIDALFFFDFDILMLLIWAIANWVNIEVDICTVVQILKITRWFKQFKCGIIQLKWHNKVTWSLMPRKKKVFEIILFHRTSIKLKNTLYISCSQHVFLPLKLQFMKLLSFPYHSKFCFNGYFELKITGTLHNNITLQRESFWNIF